MKNKIKNRSKKERDRDRKVKRYARDITIVQERSEPRLVLCPTGIQRAPGPVRRPSTFVRELMAETGPAERHYFAGKATSQEIMVHGCRGTLLFLLKP
ncbi:hypothetical protein M0802_015751 [Mischocyttarus mexicanus]|nr:hypothetical protein M0802_015751 [Mischocyttarus mexicanus]